VTDKELADMELVCETYFEKYGFPINYDNWPTMWQHVYRQGLYDMSVVRDKEARENA
jgi:hypothetical protein